MQISSLQKTASPVSGRSNVFFLHVSATCNVRQPASPAFLELSTSLLHAYWHTDAGEIYTLDIEIWYWVTTASLWYSIVLMQFDQCKKPLKGLYPCPMAKHNYKDLPFLSGEQTWLHCCIYCQGCHHWWRSAIGATQRVQFFSFCSYNWESLADCFDWSHRAVRESATEQPTIDSYTWEGLHSIGGNKSCVKIIFWCGALSTYWFVIICTNSGEGGTMPSITVWK